MQEHQLRVEYGSIYTKDGRMIETMTLLLSKQDGLLKYGNKEAIEKVYKDRIDAYTTLNLTDDIEDLFLLEFDRLEGVLTAEEICTLVNYMILTSANGTNIMELIHLEEGRLKARIEGFKVCGY